KPHITVAVAVSHEIREIDAHRHASTSSHFEDAVVCVDTSPSAMPGEPSASLKINIPSGRIPTTRSPDLRAAAIARRNPCSVKGKARVTADPLVLSRVECLRRAARSRNEKANGTKDVRVMEVRWPSVRVF